MNPHLIEIAELWKGPLQFPLPEMIFYQAEECLMEAPVCPPPFLIANKNPSFEPSIGYLPSPWPITEAGESKTSRLVPF